MHMKTHTAMKRTLLLGMALMAAVLFADGADDTLITFSTNGAEPDRYADGEAVLDGECYALVWSKDGVFDGLKADGSPVDPEDRMILVAAVADKGHCPEVLFQISADRAASLANGKYGVILLDTREKRGDAVVPRGTTGGRLTMVNGFGVVTDQMRIAASGHTTIDELLRPKGQVADHNAVAAADVPQPRIKHIWLDGDNVFLKVENLGGFMRVQGATTNGSFVTMGGATNTDGDTLDVILVAPKVGSSGFYRVLRN